MFVSRWHGQADAPWVAKYGSAPGGCTRRGCRWWRRSAARQAELVRPARRSWRVLHGAGVAAPRAWRRRSTARGSPSYRRAPAASLSGLGLGRVDWVAVVPLGGPEAVTTFLCNPRRRASPPLRPRILRRRARLLPGRPRRAGSRHERLVSDRVGGCRRRGPPIWKPRAWSARRVSSSPLARPAVVAGPAASGDVALVLQLGPTAPRRSSAFSLRTSPCERAVAVVPARRALPERDALFHIHGLDAAVLASLSAGGRIVRPLGSRRGRSSTGSTRLEPPNWNTAVPTMHQAVLARP